MFLPKKLAEMFKVEKYFESGDSIGKLTGSIILSLQVYISTKECRTCVLFNMSPPVFPMSNILHIVLAHLYPVQRQLKMYICGESSHASSNEILTIVAIVAVQNLPLLTKNILSVEDRWELKK